MSLFSEGCHPRSFASSALKMSGIIEKETYKWGSWLQLVPGALLALCCGDSMFNQLNLCRRSQLSFFCADGVTEVWSIKPTPPAE